MIKAILFDRDGVLVDSETANIDSAITALQDLSIDTTDEDVEIIRGRHPIDYVDEFISKYAIDRERFLAEREALYMHMLTDAPLNEDVVQLLKDIKNDNSYLAGLVTSSNRTSTELLINMNGLTNLFDTFVTFDDCEMRKPHPEPYLTAAYNLDVSPLDCFVIEDTALGVESAKNAGMICAVRLSKATKNMSFPRADYLVGDAREVLKYTERMM